MRLDGDLLAAETFQRFGTEQYEFAWIEVGEGTHILEGEEPFALTTYGYASAVSYGYAGGLNLRSDRP